MDLVQITESGQVMVELRPSKVTAKLSTHEFACSSRTNVSTLEGFGGKLRKAILNRSKYQFGNVGDSH